MVVSEEPRTRVFPRRWIDIRGDRIPNLWAAALRAVLGTLVFRPGISQAELSWRLRAVYDRQEVKDILRHLLEEGFIKFQATEKWPATMWYELDGYDERGVFWFLNEARHWYQV